VVEWVETRRKAFAVESDGLSMPRRLGDSPPEGVPVRSTSNGSYLEQYTYHRRNAAARSNIVKKDVIPVVWISISTSDFVVYKIPPFRNHQRI
jgi:hypothetical protein